MHKSLAFAFLTSVLSFALTAQPLKIDDGGSLIIERTTSGDRCGGTAYSPSLLADPKPAITGRREVLYTMGGVISNACDGRSLMDPTRFGDRIWYQYKDSRGSWRGDSGDASIVVDRQSFPWMADEAYLRLHPEAYVGHVGSPSVVKIDGRYFMSFVATIDDESLCAGNHSFIGTGCGSCLKPWSYFVLMWATSSDGVHWVVTERQKPIRTNRALDSAALWSLPLSWDTFGRSIFEGITRASLIVRNEENGTYFYSNITYYGTQTVKSAIVRWKYEPLSVNGLAGDPEIYDSYSQGWAACYQGELPPWLNVRDGRGDVFGSVVASIANITRIPGYRYIATYSGATRIPTEHGSAGIGNVIQYRLSNDLLHWTPAETVESSLPLFADGTSYDNSVLDPIYFERPDRSYSFFFASADGDPDHGIVRDGVHDCARPDHPMGEMSSYLGLGIYEGLGAAPVFGTARQFSFSPPRNDE